jgi:PPM family protein phosphatase
MDQKDSSPTKKELHVSAASCSDTGRVRKYNEDAIALCEPADQVSLAQLGRLYLLADGAGGHAAGEVASRVAVETIAATYYDQKGSPHFIKSMLPTPGEVTPPQDLPAALVLPARQIQQAFFAAHARLRDLSACNQKYSGMATTCVAAIVKDSQLLIAHLGDSRAYLIHPSNEALPTITRLTTDHSMVTALVQAGNHLILCCDGLWSLLSEEQIAMVVQSQSPQGACEELVRLANEAGGQDNISVIVLSFGQDQDTEKVGKMRKNRSWQRLLQAMKGSAPSLDAHS